VCASLSGRLALPDVDQPLAQHGLIDQSGPPERSGKAGRSVISRMRPAEILTTRQAESVPMLWSITLRIRTVKVAKIPRHQVRHDVAHASGGDLVAAGEAIKDQMHMVRSVAFPNESGAGRNLVRRTDHVVQEAFVVFG